MPRDLSSGGSSAANRLRLEVRGASRRGGRDVARDGGGWARPRGGRKRERAGGGGLRGRLAYFASVCGDAAGRRQRGRGRRLGRRGTAAQRGGRGAPGR